MKFKIRGTIIEELPEIEIEAETIEEAKEKYDSMYQSEDIESEGYEIMFEDEIEEEEIDSSDEELEF